MDSFLSAEAIQRWSVLSSLKFWNTDQPWSNFRRNRLSWLTPRFVPENEILIFNAPFYFPNNDFVIYIKKIQILWENYLAFDHDNGYMAATDSRFIFGADDESAFNPLQVKYEEIRAIYSLNSKENYRKYEINYGNNCKITIDFKIPKVGGIGATFGAFFGSAVTQTYIESFKINEIRIFEEYFPGFVNYIANQNKLNSRK